MIKLEANRSDSRQYWIIYNATFNNIIIPLLNPNNR